MESKSRATAVGVFVLAMVMMLVGTVFWFSHDRTKRVPYDILTDLSAEGIVQQATVELYGVNVGFVESVSFVAERPGFIRIRLMIDESAPINLTTYAMVTSRGVTGASFIELSNDDKLPQEDRSKLLRDAFPEEVPQIPLKLSLLGSLTSKMDDFAKHAENIVASVNRLISEENEQKMLNAIENIGTAASQIGALSETLNNEIMPEFKGVAQQATATLKSIDTLTNNASGLISDVRKSGGVMATISDGAKSLTRVANRLSDVTLPKVESAADSITVTLRAAKRLVTKLEDQPNMLILGPGATVAGPGEPGYKSPYAGQ